MPLSGRKGNPTVVQLRYVVVKSGGSSLWEGDEGQSRTPSECSLP